MSAELDMSQYIDLFLQEGDEQLEILETEMLALEQNPTDERLQVIFRAAHTLKGSSRAMGFSNFAELTHEMENILDQLRNHTLNLTTEITDRLLATIDTLSQMVDTIRNGEGDNVECGLLVKQLQAITNSESTEEATETSHSGASTASACQTKIDPELFDAIDIAAAESNVYHSYFKLSPDCVMKFVRAYMAVSQVEQNGELLATYPSLEDLEDEKFELEFELVFQTEVDLEEIKKSFAEISEVDVTTTAKWGRPNAEDVTPEVSSTEVTIETPAIEQEDSVNATVASTAVAQASAQNTAGSKKTESNQTVRVDVSRLDSLMNLVGELVIDRTRISQIGNDLAASRADSKTEALSEAVGHIARITSELQDQLMKARMMPVDSVFNRFPRVIRDLANKLGKDVRLEITGGETELDRSVLEVIGDPLLHILRNSVDHGLESPEERKATTKPVQGLVSLNARHQENHIVIEIIDDGKGIDAARLKVKAIEKGLLTQEAAERLNDKDALQLIFHSGLSTAKEVSEVSGRGVGMDIVRSNIQKLGGIIEIDSEVGQGSRFQLRLPLTLAIIRGLLVDVQGRIYVLPLGSVIETLLIPDSEIQTVNHQEVVVIRNVTVPIVRMAEEFIDASDRQPAKRGDQYVVIVGLANERIGLIVDRLVGEQEVVIKSLSRFCGDVSGISGATILGDGNVALIADINGLVKSNRG